jgi:hypothetical protein
MNAIQQQQLDTVIAKYSSIAGNDYDTMLEGIVDSVLDTGINTDMLSANDAEMIAEYFTETALYEGDISAFSAFFKEFNGKQLQCIQAINAITAVEEDLEVACAYIAKAMYA